MKGHRTMPHHQVTARLTKNPRRRIESPAINVSHATRGLPRSTQAIAWNLVFIL
jgi:hypothetical protein